MCQLEQTIQAFLQQIRENDAIRNIEENELVYRWNIWDEESVNQHFWELSRRMLAVLNGQGDNNDNLHGVMNDIIDKWGGIGTLGEESYNMYESILQALWNHRGNLAFQYDVPDDIASNWFRKKRQLPQSGLRMQLTVDPNYPICSSFYNAATENENNYDVTPLGTWTKVLAAYDPRRFWIYDARVALALRFLHVDNYSWYMPNPYSPYITELVSNSHPNHQLNNDDATALDSYRQYLTLLLSQELNGNHSKIRTASHFEKRLFMLGGVLRDRYEKGGEEEQNALVELLRNNN